MARSRSILSVMSFLYFVLTLGFWVGWGVVTDRDMRQSRERIAEELRSSGMPGPQAYTITSGMYEAYDSAKSYASMVIFILVICSQGLTTFAISSLPEGKATQGVPATPRT
jgi:hypothetical protein